MSPRPCPRADPLFFHPSLTKLQKRSIVSGNPTLHKRRAAQPIEEATDDDDGQTSHEKPCTLEPGIH